MAEPILPPNMAAFLQQALAPQRQRAPSMSEMLRSGVMPPTLMDEAQAQQQPMLQAGSIDYAQPETDIVPPSQRGAPLPDWYSRGRPSEGMVARPLMPQSAQEEIDQQAINRNLDTTYRMGGDLATLLLGGEVLSGINRPLRAAGALDTAPRQFATGAGTGLAMETATGRGPLMPDPAAASDAVRQLQQKLKDAGYYRGPIDGNMGPATQDAKARFDAAEQARVDAANRGAESAAKVKEAEARAAEAAAKEKETELRRTEGERKSAEREAGSQRLREADQGLLSQVLKGAISAGPYVGYGAGYVAGHKMQGALANRANAAAASRAKTADAVMGESVSADDIPARVGRLNRFWSEGNSGRIEPFRADPQSTGPYPYAPNTGNVPPASQLYNQSLGRRAMESLPVPAVGGLEHIATEFGFAGPARNELREASEAVNADPSEANIQRLQIARARAAGGELGSRLGLGMGLGSGGHTVYHSVGGSPRARPSSLSQAEAERGRITDILGRTGSAGNSTRSLTPAEIGTRRRTPGPISGGHYVDPGAPPTVGEIWVSEKGNKMWTRDTNGRFRDESGQLTSDPRDRRNWRRISSADDSAGPGGGGMAAFLQGVG